MLKYLLYIIVGLSFILFSCKPERKKKTYSEIRAYEKPLEDVNRYLLKQDEETIRNHANRRGWKIDMTKSGLWYSKLKSTNIDSINKGDLVEIEYRVELLDGTVLYNSDSLGTKVFEVGHGGVENGLEEGILMMKLGERYRFVMPPHKAHGLLGDLKKIPARSIIVYYVKVIRIEH
jgi:FKBP-type peptidyl-prolyl cis-trans isomerase